MPLQIPDYRHPVSVNTFSDGHLTTSQSNLLHTWTAGKCCLAFFSPSDNSTKLLGGPATSLCQVVLTGHGWYAAPWSVCPHIPPGLSSALLCMAERRGLTSEVPDSHVSWVLVGLINGRHWQEIGGGRKGEAKVFVSPSI